MHVVAQEVLPREFKDAWLIAAKHLQAMGRGDLNWVRSSLQPPVVEHLSFRVGNQIVFVFVELPGVMDFTSAGADLFLRTARAARAIPALLPLTKAAGGYRCKHPGWGLIDPRTSQPIDPQRLASNELIEMSDWEAQDFAVQAVVEQLQKQGKQVFSHQSYLDVDPSIWFQDERGAAWVVLRTVRYPVAEAAQPGNIAAIRRQCASQSNRGFFASVALANANDPFDSSPTSPMPLYRGHGMYVRFEGLRAV